MQKFSLSNCCGISRPSPWRQTVNLWQLPSIANRRYVLMTYDEYEAIVSRGDQRGFMGRTKLRRTTSISSCRMDRLIEQPRYG